MSPAIQALAVGATLHPPVRETCPLAVSGLTVAYDRKPVLWNIDYETPDAGLIAVIGPNGAGKSTFIKAVLGLVPTLAGQVRVFGQPVSRSRQRVGYVPQRTAVDWDFPTTAIDVVTMGLYGKIGWLRPVLRKHREQARAMLDRVGMADYADRQIGQLSGGQQQRVFLARALAQDADLYFMDEPLAGVDAATEAAIIAVLRELHQAGRTVVVVHHDLSTAPDYFDHCLILNQRKIAAGPMGTAFTADALVRAYGDRLAQADIALDRRRA